MKNALRNLFVIAAVVALSMVGFHYDIQPEPVFIASGVVLATAAGLWLARGPVTGGDDEATRIHAD